MREALKVLIEQISDDLLPLEEPSPSFTDIYLKMSGAELVQAFNEFHGRDGFEGPEGVKHFMELIGTIGDYSNLRDLLSAQPDLLVQSVYWIESGIDSIPEWRETLIEYLEEGDMEVESLQEQEGELPQELIRKPIEEPIEEPIDSSSTQFIQLAEELRVLSESVVEVAGLIPSTLSPIELQQIREKVLEFQDYLNVLSGEFSV